MGQTSKPWFVYLVRCRDGTVYTGITDDVNARLKAHSEGKGAKYTAQRRPVALIYQEPHPDRGSAQRREAQIKSWSRQRKEQLARSSPLPAPSATVDPH